MTTSFRAFVFVAISCAAACAAEGEGATADANEELRLVPAQVEDIGEFMPNSTRSVAYSGHRRYVGIRIHADKGVKIRSFIDIRSFGKQPVAAVADANLEVLAREVGGTISGGPGHSVAFAEIVAPAEGTYWLLWGEDTRHPFTLELGYSVKRSAGVECHHDNMCISESCVSERCAQTTSANPLGACIANADCTTNICVSGLCQLIPDGLACTASHDCEHHTCESGRCTCLNGGEASSDVQKCCSRHIIGGFCAG
jgi:hypothetical protein